MKKLFCFWVCFVALAGDTLGASSYQNQSYPIRSITLVCPVSPGGISDFVSRTIAAYAERHLGQRINVINKPGGTASIGLTMVAASKPDGYLIGYAPGVISGLQYLGYSDVKPEQFETIMLAVTMPAAITVQANSSYRNINDLIAAAKQRPGQLVIANAGVGSPWHMSAVALEKKTGTRFKHVPFDGSAPALVALLGGHVDAAATAPSETLAHVNAGKLRVLGVMDKRRFEPLKQTPTLKERGIPLVVVDWGGFVAPKGIPADVLEALRTAFKKAFDEKGVKELYAKQGLGYTYLSGEDFGKFTRDQTSVFKEMIANAGLSK
ncbi:MAG: tripartite tricarboxylate transporter substrate binding protein [Deltaproteobacteria bacterium]|nr:tripartite tricarboxylate transporter substrate binding protein [Deltaproteobacteria bacterium]